MGKSKTQRTEKVNIHPKPQYSQLLIAHAVRYQHPDHITDVNKKVEGGGLKKGLPPKGVGRA